MAESPNSASGAYPYRGLEPFDESDADFFFGRERETRLTIASLFAAPLTLLYGASGVGKSSVLRAGVLPELRKRKDVLPVVFPRIARIETRGSVVERGWQTDPVSGIKETLLLEVKASAPDEETRRRYAKKLWPLDMAPLAEYLPACSQMTDRRLMIILDQFEEYSLYHPEDELFAEQWPKSIQLASRDVSFMISMREDTLSKLDRFKGRIPTLWDSYRRIEHLDCHSAEDAIRLPLAEYNRRRPGERPIEIEDPLVEEVLRDVQAESVQFEESGSGTVDGDRRVGRIETPYLQLVMTRLWERERNAGSSTLRLSTLHSEGGAAEIVRTHLDRVMEHFTTEEREVAVKVFHRLVTPSGTKIAFTVRDLAEYEGLAVEQLAPILQRLEEGTRRILRRVAVRSELTDEPRYEIFHDRLGKAMLDWRARQLKEQARDRSQRQEAEQKRILAESRTPALHKVLEAMEALGGEGRAVWAAVMFYLVSTDGRRVAQPARHLATRSRQTVDDVTTVLDILVDGGILRHAYGLDEHNPQTLYEVIDDATAGALLQWHSQYVLQPAPGDTHWSSTGDEHSSSVAPSREARPFPYKTVRELLRKGRVVPFLGSGVGLSARPQGTSMAKDGQPFLPSGRELKEQIARRCDFPASEFEASDISEVASYFVQRFGRERLDDLLDEALGRSDFTPSDAHRMLAECARTSPLTILTTNYDRLMEQALDEAGVGYDVGACVPLERGDGFDLVVHGSDEREATMVKSSEFHPHSDRTFVHRMYGPAFVNGRRTGSYVLTEEEQIDWIAALDTPHSAMPAFIRAALSRCHLLSLGHSARDWSQRALLRFLHGTGERWREQSWAVALNPTPLSVMTWQRYDVKVYSTELNEWTARMRETGD